MAEQERNEQPREDQDAGRYSSTETGHGREGFTGGEDLSGREDFAGRPNVTEERQLHALDPEDDEQEARDPAR